MAIKGKYLKDENNEIFSPITSDSTVYNSSGNDTSIQAITITFEGDITLKLNNSWDTLNIPYNKVSCQINDKITYSNNQILIGSNIKYIRVSGNFNLWESPVSLESNFAISLYRNDKKINSISADTSKPEGSPLLTLVVSPAIWEVQEGDVIKFTYSSSAAGDHKVIGRNTNSYITVEKIS